MSDINFYSIANESDFHRDVGVLEPTDPNTADTLKLSNCHDGHVSAKRVVGGKEDVCDINRGSELSVFIAEIVSGGDYCFTVKGGAEDVWIEGTILKHGKVTDVDLGNISDQEKFKRTKRVHLNLKTVDGSPVKVRVLHAWDPIIENPEQAYEIDDSKKGWFNQVYRVLKHWHLVP